MDQPSMALLVPIYLASAAILSFVVIALVLLFRMRRQIERVVVAVEEVKTEVIPLAEDARVVLGSLRTLSEKAEWNLSEVGHMLANARRWSDWAGGVGERVGAVVKPPVRVVSRRLHGLFAGVRTFMTVMFHGGSHERK